MKKINRTLLQITEKYYWLWFALLCAVTAFLCFRCLGVKAIDSWDEARHGISAYEMLKNKQFLVNTYLGKPDYWNVKPPLSFLSVAAGFVLCGYNAVGLRFFSALFYLLTVIFTGLFATVNRFPEKKKNGYGNFLRCELKKTRCGIFFC